VDVVRQRQLEYFVCVEGLGAVQQVLIREGASQAFRDAGGQLAVDGLDEGGVAFGGLADDLAQDGPEEAAQGEHEGHEGADAAVLRRDGAVEQRLEDLQDALAQLDGVLGPHGGPVDRTVEHLIEFRMLKILLQCFGIFLFIQF